MSRAEAGIKAERTVHSVAVVVVVKNRQSDDETAVLGAAERTLKSAAVTLGIYPRGV